MKAHPQRETAVKTHTMVLDTLLGVIAFNAGMKVLVASGGTITGAVFVIARPIAVLLTPFWKVPEWDRTPVA